MNNQSIIKGKNNIIIKSTHAEIEITKEDVTTYVLISLEDVNAVKQHRWFMKQGYANSATAGSLHRFLMKDNLVESNLVVDHIDRNKLNNKRDNLRVITGTANSMNRSDSQFPVAGITVTAQGRYRVRLRYRDVCVLDKCFGTVNEAIRARLIAEIENCYNINQKLYDIYLTKEEINNAIFVGAINNMRGTALNKDKTAALNLMINRPILTSI